jgi:hypothetical protein
VRERAGEAPGDHDGVAVSSAQVGVIRTLVGDGLRKLRPSHLVGRVRDNRNVIGFALSELHHPLRLRTAVGAYRTGIARQNALFLRQQVDDVTDAMRHAGTSALVVDRLVERGTRPSIAARFMRRLGQAHERDSDLPLGSAHRIASERMDLHNNDLGISIAVERAMRGSSTPAGEQALEGAVLRALADGRALVLDAPTSPVRASTAAELRAVLRDPSVIA